MTQRAHTVITCYYWFCQNVNRRHVMSNRMAISSCRITHVSMSCRDVHIRSRQAVKNAGGLSDPIKISAPIKCWLVRFLSHHNRSNGNERRHSLFYHKRSKNKKKSSVWPLHTSEFTYRNPKFVTRRRVLFSCPEIISCFALRHTKYMMYKMYLNWIFH